MYEHALFKQNKKQILHRGLEELEARNWKLNNRSPNHKRLLPAQRPRSSFEVVSCKTRIKFAATDRFSNFYLKGEEKDLPLSYLQVKGRDSRCGSSCSHFLLKRGAPLFELLTKFTWQS